MSIRRPDEMAEERLAMLMDAVMLELRAEPYAHVNLYEMVHSPYSATHGAQRRAERGRDAVVLERIVETLTDIECRRFIDTMRGETWIVSYDEDAQQRVISASITIEHPKRKEQGFSPDRRIEQGTTAQGLVNDIITQSVLSHSMPTLANVSQTIEQLGVMVQAHAVTMQQAQAILAEHLPAGIDPQPFQAALVLAAQTPPLGYDYGAGIDAFTPQPQQAPTLSTFNVPGIAEATGAQLDQLAANLGLHRRTTHIGIDGTLSQAAINPVPAETDEQLRVRMLQVLTNNSSNEPTSDG